jgi:8-oxo-dGTP pyrophosphatase MutT (NUDIX family)
VAQKACPVVYRLADEGVTILAFQHPSAGKQLIKGTVEDGERPQDAALRELREESGVTPTSNLLHLGQAPIGKASTVWHFFAVEVCGLPLHWEHQTEDDEGHAFAFFWHPLAEDLDQDWHPMFHEALRMIRRSVPLS